MSPKYRQRGYMESSKDDDRAGGRAKPRNDLTSEERIQQRSLRRATQREAKEVVRCPDCGRNSQNIGTITKTSVCPHCNAPMHCCRTCRAFDSSARWQCRADIPEAVTDKAQANNCSVYEPRLVLDATGKRSSTPQSGGDAKSQFDRLFKR